MEGIMVGGPGGIAEGAALVSGGSGAFVGAAPVEPVDGKNPAPFVHAASSTASEAGKTKSNRCFTCAVITALR
jgi:hypothetical protein